jgi:N6-L-threonylcarbamoyladenine synthase
MKILAIETSCDETAAAVVENEGAKKGLKILANITASSMGIHARTGGVIPEQAARKQIQAVIPVIELALKESKTLPRQLDALAVTKGPGLAGSLLIGVETAKTLSYLWKKPIIPVNHLLGHIYSNWLRDSKSDLSTSKKDPEFPLLALTVSGGHTDLVFMTNHKKLKWIGGTRDDAAGEAFDKCARLLGLPYPGGPKLSKIADEYIKAHPKEKLDLFPRPMIHEDNFDWSFSGLKTACLNEVKKISGKSKTKFKLSDYQEFSKNANVQKHAAKIAAEIQEAIVDSLVIKSIKAIEYYKPKSFLLGGGVAANNCLRKRLVYSLRNLSLQPQFHVPVVNVCTDNAASIAAAAFYNYRPFSWKKIDINPELTIDQKVI